MAVSRAYSDSWFQSSQEAIIRCSAARALGELGDRAALSPLARLATDQDSEIRKVAVDAIRELRRQLGESAPDPAMCDALLLALSAAAKDAEKDVRFAAAQALATLRDPRALEPLVGLLADRVTNVRYSAALGLADLSDPAATPMLLARLGRERSPTVQLAICEALGTLGDAQALPALIAALGEPNQSVRSAAALSLAQVGGEEASAALMRLVADTARDVDLRRDAAFGLGAIVPPHPGLAAVLLRAVADPSDQVRLAAAGALGVTRDGRAVEPLIAALGDPDPQVALWAALSLGDLADTRAVEPLIVLLRHADPWARWAAMQALAQLQDRRAIPALDEAAARDEGVIKRGGSFVHLRDVARNAATMLHESRTDPDPWWHARFPQRLR